MTPAELDELYETYQMSIWRLETRPNYVVPDDGPRLEAWRAGRPLPMRRGKERWLNEVRQWVAAGKQVGRAHIVDLPLSDYQRYELDVYRENATAGEGVWIVDRAADPRLAGRDDFLLVDDLVAVWFDYDQAGRLLGYRRSDDALSVSRCREIRALVMSLAVPLNEFITKVQ